MAHGQLDDEAATRLCAQLLTLDAEGDEPIRFELQNLGAGLSAALTVMGVLDVVGVPVQARAAGQINGPALGVLAACGQRCAYPNAVFVLSEPTMEFDGTMMAITAREEQIRTMLDALYFRLAEVTGREVDEIRGDAQAHRILTAGEAQRYGLLTGQIERDRAPRPQDRRLRPQDPRLRPQDPRLRPQDPAVTPAGPAVTPRRTRGYARRTRGYARRTRGYACRARGYACRTAPPRPPAPPLPLPLVTPVQPAEAPSRPRSGRVTSAPGEGSEDLPAQGRRVVSAYCAAMRPQSHHMTPCLTRKGGGERDRDAEFARLAARIERAFPGSGTGIGVDDAPASPASPPPVPYGPFLPPVPPGPAAGASASASRGHPGGPGFAESHDHPATPTAPEPGPGPVRTVWQHAQHAWHVAGAQWQTAAHTLDPPAPAGSPAAPGGLGTSARRRWRMPVGRPRRVLLAAAAALAAVAAGSGYAVVRGGPATRDYPAASLAGTLFAAPPGRKPSRARGSASPCAASPASVAP